MNDLQEIKNKIIEEDKVELILNKLGCIQIKKRSNRYEAGLPPKFNHNNNRAVQVLLNNSLSSKIYNIGITDIDIYGLVSYIEFECLTLEEQKVNLIKAKKWIANIIQYSIDNRIEEIIGFENSDPLEWLHGFRKTKNNNKKIIADENKVYSEKVMDQYLNYPISTYISEGISAETQKEFQVGFDLKSERIIFPIHNKFGEIISVKGRTIDEKFKSKSIPKFMYLYNYNKAIELYNWHRSVFYILEKKEVIIFESEKSCWLSTQFGHRNCVAIGGSDLSESQVNIIKDLGMDIKIIIALDKDKEKDDFFRQGMKFGKLRNIYALWDSENKLSRELKHSPVDLGEKIFKELYNNYKKFEIKEDIKNDI